MNLFPLPYGIAAMIIMITLWVIAEYLDKRFRRQLERDHWSKTIDPPPTVSEVNPRWYKARSYNKARFVPAKVRAVQSEYEKLKVIEAAGPIIEKSFNEILSGERTSHS